MLERTPIRPPVPYLRPKKCIQTFGAEFWGDEDGSTLKVELLQYHVQWHAVVLIKLYVMRQELFDIYTHLFIPGYQIANASI